jgi:type IV secretory pathway ATPase VirB11/archaellum biosynthesis ATPase
VNAGIRDIDIQYYYVDLDTQPETIDCIEAVEKRRFLLLAGSRASGKTTRMYRIIELLEGKSLVRRPYVCMPHAPVDRYNS